LCPDDLSPLGKTALYTCAERAVESCLPEEERVFYDPLAERLAGQQGTELVSRFHQIHSGARTLPVNMSVVIRTKFFDEVFNAAVSEWNIGQVVIIAAGMDTRFLRLTPSKSLHVWELDFPQVLGYKRARLPEWEEWAASYHFVPVDFRLPDWDSLLLSAGYLPDVPSLWIIEGLFVYLEDKVIDELLAKMKKLTCPRSIVTGDWMTRSYLSSAITYQFRNLFDQLGSPFINGRDPNELVSWLGCWAFSVHVHPLGDRVSHFTHRFPWHQVVVAERYWPTEMPAHYLFLGERTDPLMDHTDHQSSFHAHFVSKHGSGDRPEVSVDTSTIEFDQSPLSFQLVNFFLDSLKISSLDPEDDLFDYGLDSLIVIQLGHKLTQAFPDHRLFIFQAIWRCSTLGNFQSLLATISSPGPDLAQ